MTTISGMIRRLAAVNIDKICDESVDQTKDMLLQKNKDQLYDGKLSTGQDLSPSYFDDPYFKSPESAKKYSDWKDRITPNPDRKKGVPNLFINGAFYDSLKVAVSAGTISTDSSFSASANIESKFSTKIFGLGGKYKLEYLSKSLQPEFKVLIEAATKLKMGHV